MKIRLIRFSYFVWVIIPIALWLIYLTFGLPHMIWSYSWKNNGQGYDPFADRYYTRCTYIGPYGYKNIRPVKGKCRFIRLVKDKR